MHRTDSTDTSLWDATAGPGIEAAPLEGETEADVAIVGGGFTGCSAALHLAEGGASVRLIEARDIGFGGSGRNAGLVNAGLWLDPDVIEAQLGREVGARLNERLSDGPGVVFGLIEKHAIACEAARNGTLHCAHSPAGLKALESRARQMKERGAPVEMISAREAAERTGTGVYFGAILDHRTGTIQPKAYVRGLARAAMKAGATLHQDSPVTGIERVRDRWEVRAGRGRVRARALLVATNAYHQGLPAKGAPTFVPVHYFQLATRPLSHNVARSILPGREGAWDSGPVMSSFRMDAMDRFIIGAVGSLDAAGGAVHRSWAKRRARKLFPQLEGAEFEHAWFGRIAMTGDHLPRIFRVGPDAYSIYGYSGRGISPGTVFGKAMAECLLAEGEKALPLAPIEAHDESWRTFRQLSIEAGATAVHFASDRA